MSHVFSKTMQHCSTNILQTTHINIDIEIFPRSNFQGCLFAPLLWYRLIYVAYYPLYKWQLRTVNSLVCIWVFVFIVPRGFQCMGHSLQGPPAGCEGTFRVCFPPAACGDDSDMSSQSLAGRQEEDEEETFQLCGGQQASRKKTSCGVSRKKSASHDSHDWQTRSAKHGVHSGGIAMAFEPMDLSVVVCEVRICTSTFSTVFECFPSFSLERFSIQAREYP